MKKRGAPVLVVILLIIIIGGVGAAIQLIQKYTPTKEVMDSTEYFGAVGEGEVSITMGTELLETRGLKDGEAIYLPQDLVNQYLNKRFYWDANEQIMIYTTPTEKYVIAPDATTYTINDGDAGEEAYTICKVQNETLYINIDFVQKFTNMEYTTMDTPSHVAIRYEWTYQAVAADENETAVRYQGGIKSPILTTVAKGTQLRVLEELEDWDEVVTEDGFIGYVRKSDLQGNPEEYVEERDFTEPEYTAQTRDFKINLAWHQVTSEAANETLDDTVKDMKGVNVISPTWFSIRNNNGKITNFATEGYVTKAHNMGLEVWGLVDNFSADISTFEVLSHTKTRTALINNLVKQAVRFSLDGINIDFETLSEDAAPHFIQFLRELSILCRANHLVLSVDNPPPENYTGFYDRASQGEVVDYVIIMGYDEHYMGSEEAGSVASLPWVEQGIQDTLTEVPASKVINAIPFYTRVWKTVAGVVSSEAVGMDAASKFISDNNIETYWDQEAGQNYGEIDRDDGFYQVWLEDEESIGAKMELVKKYELAGVAEWKLTFERASIWDVISQGLQ